MISKIHYLWIWLWYNDITRILFVLLPGHFIFSIPLMLYFEVPANYFSDGLVASYVVILLIAMLDNDYSNLRKIGLDEYRKKLNN